MAYPKAGLFLELTQLFTPVAKRFGVVLSIVSFKCLFLMLVPFLFVLDIASRSTLQPFPVIPHGSQLAGGHNVALYG